jgi:hypothetical protein
MLSVDMLLWGLLGYVVFPLWLLSGVADYLCHARSDIAHTSGTHESMLHLLQTAEIGLPVLVFLIRLSARAGVRQHDLLLGEVGHSELLTAFLLAKVIVSRVYRQPVQPGFKDLCRPQLVEREVKPQENFLTYVLNVLRTGDQPRNGPQNSLPVSQHDFIERGAIPILRPLDQLKIYQHAAPWTQAAESLGSEWKGVPPRSLVTQEFDRKPKKPTPQVMGADPPARTETERQCAGRVIGCIYYSKSRDA